MPTPIAHTAIALGIYMLSERELNGLLKKPKEVMLVCSLCLLPDMDFIPVLLTGDFGYHRHFSHSVAFALLATLIIYFLYSKRAWLFHLRNFLIILSHTA
jgi:membrane-bound metal-dependent hydrolase YbcI (DUF457 family)